MCEGHIMVCTCKCIYGGNIFAQIVAKVKIITGVKLEDEPTLHVTEVL